MAEARRSPESDGTGAPTGSGRPRGPRRRYVALVPEPTCTVHAPGRVNLIGDHTDYTGGLVFPMAIDRGTTFTGARGGERVVLTSDDADGTVDLAVPIEVEPATVEPHWGSYVAAVAAEIGATDGLRGHLVSTIPAGAGLSSSAALMCAIGLALGFDGTPLELAQLARRAEHAATGVPTGIMDQYCIAAARAGHATMIDCHALTVEHVPIPDDVEVVVQFVAHRTLLGSEYADRVAECARAEAEIGPLRHASTADAETIADEVIRRRARHVVTENRRVRDFAAALTARDFVAAGDLMLAGHASLRDDFATSTPVMDEAVETLAAQPGVYGARMTGGGFGGCVVALTEPAALDVGWVVTASAGAHVVG